MRPNAGFPLGRLLAERTEGRIVVGLVGPDVTGLAPGGMATISRGVIDGFAGPGGIEVVAVSNFEEGSLRRRLEAGLSAIGVVIRARRALGVVHLQVATGWSVERDLLLALAARWCRIPVVMQFHGADQRGDYEESGRFQQAMYRRLINISSYNMALGGRAARWLEELAPSVPVMVVPNFAAVPAEVVPLPGTPGGLVFVGRLGERKGIFDLLEALVLLGADGEAPDLMVVGDGDIDGVKARVESSEILRRHVTVCGWRSGSEVAELLNESWALVLPSYAEGLPMAVLEAMAAGRPVISTRVGEVEDAVTDGVSGLLVEPGDVPALADAIRRVLGDREWAAVLGRQGRATAEERFTKVEVLRRLADVYRDSAGSDRPQTGTEGNHRRASA
jgi:glycosyltransferase involved in cell wall biosynthesis